ncbi:hypothetical protein O181_088891 [Austropuccinia psidii MF-1]|uniref:Uncharacterized protein n=1 Tax=Austropuccinia psidii MF-1 TaxID=1389203 RepID=A0A9Q3ISE5_9BASI|nr:hypothetical protein [Austropuccinia psidii MF-1]
MIPHSEKIVIALQFGDKRTHDVRHQNFERVFLWDVGEGPRKPVSTLCNGPYLTVERSPAFGVRKWDMLLKELYHHLITGMFKSFVPFTRAQARNSRVRYWIHFKSKEGL